MTRTKHGSKMSLMVEVKDIPKAKSGEIESLSDLGRLAIKIYKAGIQLATEANSTRKTSKGSIANDQWLTIEKGERSFIKELFKKKGWNISITSKHVEPNDIQMTEGRSTVEITIKKAKKTR